MTAARFTASSKADSGSVSKTLRALTAAIRASSNSTSVCNTNPGQETVFDHDIGNSGASITLGQQLAAFRCESCRVVTDRSRGACGRSVVRDRQMSSLGCASGLCW